MADNPTLNERVAEAMGWTRDTIPHPTTLGWRDLSGKFHFHFPNLLADPAVLWRMVEELVTYNTDLFVRMQPFNQDHFVCVHDDGEYCAHTLPEALAKAWLGMKDQKQQG